jgi:hypothetical protein
MDRLGRVKWYTGTTRTKNLFYAVRDVNRKKVFLHREVLNTPNGLLTDHVNHDGLDNRRHNLRSCSPSQNSAHSKVKRLGRPFRGVKRWISPKDGRHIFYVFVQKDGVKRNVGTYNDPIEAAKAHDRAAIEIHGEFAVLNFPLESLGFDDKGSRDDSVKDGFSDPMLRRRG